MKFFLFATGLILLLWGINLPFAGGFSANNNYLSLAAKNYQRFGYTNLKFFPTYFAGAKLPVPVPYYLHHPILIFPLIYVSFTLLGIHNWVVHIPNLLFLLGDIFLIYKIGLLVWNKKIGMWAAAITIILPMVTFFWKFMMFEQGSLFFNLCVFYFVYRYYLHAKNAYLVYIFVFTLLSGLMDWGVLYLLVPLIIFQRKSFKPVLFYALGAVISLGFFIVSVFMLRGGFAELAQAINVHAYTSSLLNLPLWPVRLTVITILRIIVYFSPLTLLWLKDFSKSKTLLFFFIFGCMNILVLPTVTWEINYFLFYFVPFFAFAGAHWIVHRNRWIILLIIWSIAVNYFKLQQIEKQVWKYDAAVEINKSLAPYETVEVVNFPGDIFENYFYHPTVPKKKITALPIRTVYTCETGCQKAELLPKFASGTVAPAASSGSVHQGILLTMYRFIRDTLKAGEL